MIEFKSIIETRNGGVKSLRREPVEVEGPITLEEYKEQLRVQWVAERVGKLRSETQQKPVSPEEMSKWEASGAPRLTTEEVNAQILQEIAPNVLFNFSAQSLDSNEYTPLTLYQTARGGKLSSIEIEARRLKQTDRASIRISANFMGQEAHGLPGKLALIDTNNDYQKKVRLSNGAATFYKMRSGEYTLQYLHAENKVASLAEIEALSDETPVQLQTNGVIYRAPMTSFNLPKFPGTDMVRGSVRAIGHAAAQTVLFWRP